MTPTELLQLCAHWQAVLRLQDWDVEVKLVHSREIEHNAGQCQYNVGLHKAWIKIADPKFDDNPEDTEATLVHELLHLHAAPFHNPDVERLEGARLQALEIMIEQVSKALVEMDRVKQREVLEAQKAIIDQTLKALEKERTR